MTRSSPDPSRPATALDLLDWRRRVTALYAEIRATTDPAAAHARWRQTRDELFANHRASPLLPDRRDEFRGLGYGPYDPARRFRAELDTDVEASTFDVPTGTDGLVSFERIGRLHLDDVGSLDVWRLRSYGNGLFVPVRDPSPSTYGGGRYVLDTAKGADLGGNLDPATGRGTLVVDLNFAYNPSCAYDPAWACPLAPRENTLTAPLECGELVAPAAVP